MHFTKMQGLGNDYLYVYGEVPENVADITRKMSDRHFGAGSDGMIYISTSETADFSMRIFNADGSEGKMCGNGIRCVGKYVYDKGYTDRTRLSIETLSGIRTLELRVRGGKVREASVDMGSVTVSDETAVDSRGQTVRGFPVSVGNPHFVIFVPDVRTAPVETLGPVLEKHHSFPGGVNVEFVEACGKNRLRMRVWERGSGVTLACGTGACAAAAAAVRADLCDRQAPVSVVLDGGVLSIELKNDGTAVMTGPAETVYEGEAEL